MFHNNDIPEGYNKIAEISDNYVVWTNESKLESGRNYTVYYEYLQPSWLVVPIDNYQIKSGTEYTYVAHYNNSGMYSYLDYYDVDYSLTTMSPDSDILTDNDFDRADMPLIFICQFILVFCFVWIINQLSKLIHKGGAFSA